MAKNIKQIPPSRNSTGNLVFLNHHKRSVNFWRGHPQQLPKIQVGNSYSRQFFNRCHATSQKQSKLGTKLLRKASRKSHMLHRMSSDLAWPLTVSNHPSSTLCIRATENARPKNARQSLATPGEYDWTVNLWRQCSLMSNHFDHLLVDLLFFSSDFTELYLHCT